jgi:hypothetical protein
MMELSDCGFGSVAGCCEGGGEHNRPCHISGNVQTDLKMYFTSRDPEKGRCIWENDRYGVLYKR